MFPYLSNLLPRLLNINLLYVFFGFITVHKDQILAQKCSLSTYDSAVTLRTTGSAQFCGGVLLQARWVLTAGHCVYDRRDPDSIGVMGRGFIPNTHRVIQVQKIYVQDIYDPKTLENDVSLLFLSAGFSGDITYASIAGTDLFVYLLDLQDEDSVLLTWKGNRPGQSSHKLMDLFCITVGLLSTEECVRFYRISFENETMFCTTGGPKGEQPCRGDSGSPIFVKGVVLGVVSFGVDCNTKNALSMFARVDRAIRFIEKAVRGNGHGFGNRTVQGFLSYYVEARGAAVEGSLFVILVLGLVLRLL